MDGDFECEFCWENFQDKELLEEHVKKEHPFDYDNWISGLVGAGIAFGLSLLDEEEDFDSEDDSGGFGGFGGGSFSGGGADGDW